MYLPPGLPAQDAPVMVVLHGCLQDMHAIARGTRINMLADTKGFGVIYVQQAVRNNSSGCWRWFSAHGEQEADTIASIIMRAVSSYGFNAGRVYIAGMSAGAGMVALVALRHPTLVSAVAMHSGAVVGGATSAQAGMRVMRHGTAQPPANLLKPYLGGIAAVGAMPAIILHGDADQVVAPRNAAQLAAQFLYLNRADPATGRTTVLAKGTKNEYSRTDYGPDKAPVVRVCLVRQLEHAWSGGNGDIRFHANAGPDAAALIWRFFAAHRRGRATL
nr:prolyl oligopeptidase family serine peptidase [Pseudomonas sp.]